MRLPPPPVVAGTLSGFVIGVLLTLLATGAMSRASVATSSTPTVQPAATFVPDTQLKQQINRTVSKILGPEPSDPKKSRLLATQTFPVGPNDLEPGREFAYPGYRSVLITWRLNDHPFGPSWRLRAAQADIFAVLKALYTSQLNIFDVQMDGMFPLHLNRPHELNTAVRAYMSYNQAQKIPWRHWGRSDEARLWRMLSSVSVDSRFG